MAELLGSNSSGSPSDKSDDELDNVQTNDGTDASPTSATAKAEAPPDAVTRLLEGVKSGALSTVDESEASTPAEPAEPAKEKSADASAKEPTAQPEKPAAKDPARDPLADWSPMEKEHTKGKVKDRFRKLHEMHDTEVQVRTKLQTDLDAAQADATYGRAFRDIGEKFQVKADMDQLEDEQMAWSIKAQAAAIRSVQAVTAGRDPSPADLETIDGLRQGLDIVYQHLGRVKPGVDNKAILAALDEVGDYLPEDALKKLRKLVGEKPADEQAPPARAERPQPQRNQPQEQQPAQRQSDPDLEAQRVRTVNAIVQSGIPAGQVEGHYKEHLMPLVAKNLSQRFPRLHPDVAWQRTAPAERTALILEAIVTEQQGRRTAPITPASRPVSSSAPIRSVGRAPAPPARSQSSGDPVKDALARVRSGTASTSEQ